MSHKISVIISCAVLITQFLPNATLPKPDSTQGATSWIKERTFIFTEVGFNTGSCFLNWRKNIYLYRSRVQHKELLLELKKEHLSLPKSGSTQGTASWIKERTFIFTEVGFNTGSCFLNWRKNIYLYRSRVQHKELLLELKKEHLSLPKPGSTQGTASWTEERTFIII